MHEKAMNLCLYLDRNPSGAPGSSTALRRSMGDDDSDVDVETCMPHNSSVTPMKTAGRVSKKYKLKKKKRKYTKKEKKQRKQNRLTAKKDR